jgi:hypothetical protein
LVDGQHRLWAIQHLGITVVSWVLNGLDQDSEASVDTGRPRTANQYFNFHQEKYAGTLTATLRLLLLFERGILQAGGWERNLSNGELFQALEKHPDVRRSVERVQPLKKIGVVLGHLALLHYLAVKAGLNEQIESFLVGLDRGVGLQDDEPAYRLRERLIGNMRMTSKIPTLDKLALVIKAWNLHLAGARTKALAWKGHAARPEPFPTILLETPR